DAMAAQAILLCLTGLLSTLIFPPVMCSTCPSGFTLIDFDEFSGGVSPLPPFYRGLEWTNAGVVARSYHPTSGYVTALSSGEYVSFNGGGNLMSISVGISSPLEAFSIKSFVIAAAWKNDLQLSMTGWRSEVRVHNQTIILQTKLATDVVLDWRNIDKINFETFGGTNAMLGDDGTHFGMDNLCITTGSEEPQELLYKCDYWGDPQLIQFPKAAGSIASSTWCQITGSSILYQSSYVLINVVNSGSQRGDIVTSFAMTFYNDDNISLCTLTPSDMTGIPQSCGPDVRISKTGYDLNVAYRKAPFSAWIRYSSWGGGHYKFTLFATLTHINAASTTGMCVNGCRGKRSAPQMIITESTTHKEIVTSSMADKVCDTFMKEATQQLPRNGLVVETTPGYLDAVRQACIIDVTVTGSTQFAEQSVSNVITDILTHKGEINIEDMSDVIKNITHITEQTATEAEIEVETMIENSTLPCKPGCPQSSVLSPTLFIIYNCDLGSSLANCTSHLFADDLAVIVAGQLGIKYSYQCLDLEKRIKVFIDHLEYYSYLIDQPINTNKTQALFTARAIGHPKFDIHFNSGSKEKINWVPEYKYLGYIISSKLVWDKFLTFIMNKVEMVRQGTTGYECFSGEIMESGSY
ncbi:unnamed protein product, partial [Rotaria magnacalcarata]